METWFDRAMKSNPGNHDACYSKLRCLMPVWHGSFKEMLEFGRTCVDSKVWRGRVPLILADAHSLVGGKNTAKEACWRRPAVWPDVHSSFEKFFQLNPNAKSWRQTYARYAYVCQQWDELQHQLDLMGTHANHDYFGGVTEFEKMKRLAAEKTGRTTAAETKSTEAPR